MASTFTYDTSIHSGPSVDGSIFADAPPGSFVAYLVESTGIGSDLITFDNQGIEYGWIFQNMAWSEAYAQDGETLPVDFEEKVIQFIFGFVPLFPSDDFFDRGIDEGVAGPTTSIKLTTFICEPEAGRHFARFKFNGQPGSSATTIPTVLDTSAWPYPSTDNPLVVMNLGAAWDDSVSSVMSGSPLESEATYGDVSHPNVAGRSGVMDYATYPLDDSGAYGPFGELEASFNQAGFGFTFLMDPRNPSPTVDPAPAQGVDDPTLPLRVVQTTSLTLQGADIGREISFEPYTHSTGSLYVLAVEFTNSFGIQRLSLPNYSDLDEVNALAGWGSYDLMSQFQQSSQIMYAPVQGTDGYLTFPIANSNGIIEETVLRARLYEFESDLGDIVGYADVVSHSVYGGDVERNVSPWSAAPSGYHKDGGTITFAVRGQDSSDAVVTDDLDVHLVDRVGPFGDYSSLGYGQTPMWEGANFTLAGEDDVPASLLVMRIVERQSRYNLVHKASGATPLAVPSTTFGNLLILTARSTAPLDLSDFDAWGVHQTVRSTGGLYLTTLWMAAPPVPLSVISVPGATEICLLEVSGFTGQPVMLKDVSSDSTVSPGDPGYSPGLHGGQANMPISVPHNDAVFFASLAGEIEAEEAFLLPDFSIYTSPRRLMSSAEGWDFYPDLGVPVSIVGQLLPHASVIGHGALFIDASDEPEPEPPSPVNTINLGCPKSVRACAMRITKTNNSGVPLDPMTPRSRIQTAGFMELSLNPDFERGSETVIKSNGSEGIAIINRGCDILKGMELTLKLCGVPHHVLEILTGADRLTENGQTVGGMLPEQQGADCVSPVIIELWSKNVGEGGGWIHWVVPKSFKWNLSSSLSFSNGPLELELTGYGQGNPAWYPSIPDSDKDFKAYVPGGGDPDGWPTGAPGGIMVPGGVSLDPWTLDDVAKIRRSGPLAWRIVGSLPEPLDDCDFLAGACEIDSTFCGPEGDPLPSPWFFPDFPSGALGGA